VIETLAGSDDPGAARLLTNGYAAFEPAARGHVDRARHPGGPISFGHD